MSNRWLAIAAALAATTQARAQQVADTSFRYRIEAPAYAGGSAPVVAIDESHHNFHTVDGRYAPFAALLRSDGYTVVPFRSEFSDSSLAHIQVLVIANPLNAVNAIPAGGRWALPIPSAFSDAEISALHAWVACGGSLLLIADHMPFAGAAGALALGLGLHYSNGFAYDTVRGDPTPFRRSDGSLGDHAITRGRSAAERIDSVFSFTGSAFQADSAVPILTLGPAARSLEPRIAWQFDSTTVIVPAGGWRQGAALHVGRGRVAAFGEAAMFSAQIAGPARARMGMNAPFAAQNPQFLLNVMHWLTGLLGP